MRGFLKLHYHITLMNISQSVADFFSSLPYATIFTFIILLINFLLAIGMIFWERKSAQSVWAWLFVLFFIPIIGFILYVLFGRTIYNKEIFKISEEDKVGLESLVTEQLEDIKMDKLTLPSEEAKKHRKLIHMLLNNNQSFITSNNKVETFYETTEFFDQMIHDIENAKDHIHFQFYIFRLDSLGQRIYDALLKKQKEGVDVKILYDDMGSRTLKLRNFKELRDYGGKVEAFFPSRLSLINPRMNNRNHRKNIVIDGKIAYTGGTNVGEEYIGLSKKFGYWRDTHIRVQGNAVKSLQLRFMLDWNSHATRDNLKHHPRYFPEIPVVGDTTMQIAASGPDEEWEQIKYGYLKMINSAKKSIYIQSPYFIPDQSMREAIKIALLSGVEVNIMIPPFPDHPFVYWGTYHNVGELAMIGANVYIYERGFLHQKVMIIDDEVVSIGSCNMDNRSYALNFEVNAFIFDEKEAIKNRLQFEKDALHSRILSPEVYQSRSKWIKFKEAIANLIAPIL